ncbi:MAG: electron transfer flavoprotein subunit alpha/FixB family protein [Deltaproteobacteria bacterium]|nr:electron transfer flavoprotein subunit alpha/FixB family protein [Deltaproteobacteria bacterium]
MKVGRDSGESGGIWIFVEQKDGKVARVSLELLGKGRILADKLHVGLTAFLIGYQVSGLANELIFYGADQVILAEAELLRDYRTEVFSEIICKQAMKEKPEIMIIGASPIGRDLAPRVAFRLGTGCTADCTDLDVDLDEKLLVSTRPAFGGNVMATIVCPDHRPQMATVRPGVMPLPQRDESRTGRVITLNPHIDEKILRVEILETAKKEDYHGKIDEAKRIVALGMGAKDTVDLVKELAEALDAEVGATRLAVEEGWMEHDFQIGQTGKTVRPDLYIACGVSGAIQHIAGMSDSKLIIAINKDPEAEIFKVADYGIVGDLGDIIPAVVEAIRRSM